MSVRDEVKLASGDYIDLKMYEPAMRHLLDTYIRAEDSEKISAFNDMSLVEILAKNGMEGLETVLPDGVRSDREALAETIENNVRRVISERMVVNPEYYRKMSELLEILIQARKQQAEDYKDYLKKIEALARKVMDPGSQGDYPPTIHTDALRALYDNLVAVPSLSDEVGGTREPTPVYLSDREAVALQLDEAIRSAKKDGWRGNRFKQRQVRNAIKHVLGADDGLVDRIFEIVKNQHEY